MKNQQIETENRVIEAEDEIDRLKKKLADTVDAVERRPVQWEFIMLCPKCQTKSTKVPTTTFKNGTHIITSLTFMCQTCAHGWTVIK